MHARGANTTACVPGIHQPPGVSLSKHPPASPSLIHPPIPPSPGHRAVAGNIIATQQHSLSLSTIAFSHLLLPSGDRLPDKRRAVGTQEAKKQGDEIAIHTIGMGSGGDTSS